MVVGACMALGKLGGGLGSQVRHLILHPLEQLGPVFPLTDALQAVHQVGESFREVGPQLQCFAVGGDGRVLTACVLVRARQVGVSLWRLCLKERDVLIASNGFLDAALHQGKRFQTLPGLSPGALQIEGFKRRGFFAV